MVGGAVSYMISNPGADLGDMLGSACFWKSVVIGGITGAVSGLFTGFLGGLGILGTNFIQTVVLGAFTGFISGGVGEGVNQLLTFGKITNWNAVLGSAITGAITGAIFSAIGYGIGTLAAKIRSGLSPVSPPTLPKLEGSILDAFEGAPVARTLSPGTLIYRAELRSQPVGHWFGTQPTTSLARADRWWNVLKWGPRDILRTYEVAETIVVYYGKVKEGTGAQIYIPKEIDVASILKKVAEWALH